MLRRSRSTVGPAPTPTENTAAFNALMYRYANTSVLHTAQDLPTVTTWWKDGRIDATVTRAFLAANLRVQVRHLLDRPVAFGLGLTDDTYGEWILKRAKRLFLILLDIGLAHQIFDIVDDVWDDEDLPISDREIEDLPLSPAKDESLSEKFYKRQFFYLIREIKRGDHVTYSPDEVVPLELCSKRPGVAFYHTSEKVYLPDRPKDVFTRKRVAFNQCHSLHPEQDFRASIESMKSAVHDHLVSVFASYTFDNSGFVLSSPTTDLTLRTFINLTPQHFRKYPKATQRHTLLNWLHCLADAVAFLHSRGLSHQNIRPSSILIDSADRIILGDNGGFDQLLGSKRPNPLECYDYGAPETWSGEGAVFRNSTDDPRLKGPRMSGMKFRPDSSVIAFAHPAIREDQSAEAMASAKQADVFSLGCVFLDILSFLLKRKLTTFTSHRSAKNKSALRGGGPADTSFHANLGQVESWIGLLEKRATKKDEPDLRSLSPTLRLCQYMLARKAPERPTARFVEEIMHDVLTGPRGIGSIHCGSEVEVKSSFDGCDGETASVATKQSSTDSSSSKSMDTIRLKARAWNLGPTSVFDYS
ncbi:MAG: hypothetical protein M1838_001382 [Thelocarpon superellum]|nr:MAG: hypothetical protein M1838_001382 [Thelocarpon superellum]